MEKHPRIELTILAFALHGILAPFTGLDHDIQVWIQVSEDLFTGRNPYVIGLTKEGYYAYPPLWAYILLSMRILSEIIGNNEYITRYLIKLPMIIAQIACAWLGAEIISQHHGSKDQQNQTFLFLLLNPFFFLIGSMWGMFDIIPTFFCLAMIYVLGKNDQNWITPSRPLLAGACLAGAFLSKLFPIILLPLCLIYLRRHFYWIWFLLGFCVASALVCAPYFFQDQEAFLHIFSFHAERIGGGITYWNGLWLLIDQGVITEATATEWSGYYLYPFAGALLLTYLVFWNSSQNSSYSLLAGSAMIVWVFSFSFKLVYEQYCVWITTFTIIFLILTCSNMKLRIGAILTIIVITMIYLTISVPLPDLFYIDMLREQREIFEQYSFYEKQQVLFALGSLFAAFHFTLWIIGIKSFVNE